MNLQKTEGENSSPVSRHPDLCTYTFQKDDGTWYIHLPEYLKEGGKKEDLRMKAGAERLLKIFAGGENQVTLIIATEPFEGAGLLELIDLCSPPRGGGIYLMEQCNGYELNAFIWICDIALFVFGDLPKYIYIRKAGN